MKKLVFLFAACFFMQSIVSYAQLSTGESPVSFSLHQINWRVPAVTLPALDMATINREDSADDEQGIPPRFGYPHKVNLNLENAGEWKVLPNGDKLWNLTITCPGAKSINLLYDKYWLPEGAKLFVFSKDRARSIGAFTSQNNKGTKADLQGFATGLVYDDTIVVEYFEPNNVTEKGIVSIYAVVQGYKYIDITRESWGFGASSSCQVNVNCSEGQGWQNEKNAIAMIVVEGSRYCTGTLINTTANDYSPLLLTSNSCILWHDATNSPVLNAYSFVWHYESPSCNNPVSKPSNYYYTSGATVLANKDSMSGCDFALLSLTEDPKSNPNIPLYYLGWDNSGYTGSSFVCIHHPLADMKKIATRNSSFFANNSLWKLNWDQTANGYGFPENGSTGAALINNNRHIIGQLCANNSFSCSNPGNGFSTFGKFYVSWTGNGDTNSHRRLQPWLDPQNTSATTLDGIGLRNDLYVRDTVTDDGTEPSLVRHQWDSPDIWIEDYVGNVITNPYGNGWYYVCVRVHNRSSFPSRGNERLLLNWSKAGVSLVWNDSWSGNSYFACGQPKGGFIDSVSIPVIQAYGHTVVRVPWQVPSLAAYDNCTEFGGDRWHFCLLARVHDGSPIAHENETNTSVYQMTLDHNNVAWKNLYTHKDGDVASVIIVGNPKPITASYLMELVKKANASGEKINEYAEVLLTLDAGLLNAISGTITGAEWVNSNTLRIQETDVQIPLTLPANSNYTTMTTVHFLADQIPANNNFDFDIVLHNANGDSILGGEHYKCVRTNGRYFQAIAHDNMTILWGETASLYATDILETAEYKWYDDQGNEVGDGLTCNVSPQQNSTYTLRVTADADGYRAYSTVTVMVVDGELRLLAPNPADNQVRIGYALSRNVSSATLQIINGSGQVVHSQMLNGGNGSKVTGETLVNTSSLAAGSYTVRLVSNTGKVYSSKILVIQ